MPIKRIFKRLVSKNVDFSDSHHRFEMLYLVSDPYALTSDAEGERFTQTNRFIANHAPQTESLFEFGCGEGHQTLEFLKIAKRVVGNDISPSAVKRARRRCPQATFVAGNVLTMDFSGFGVFSVSTACEVLYYLGDPDAHLDLLESVSRNVVVSYFNKPKYSEKLDPIVARRNPFATEIVKAGPVEWKIAIWRGKTGP